MYCDIVEQENIMKWRYSEEHCSNYFTIKIHSILQFLKDPHAIINNGDKE